MVRLSAVLVGFVSALIISGCGFPAEHMCSDGYYFVHETNGGTGASCAKDGDEPGEGFEAFPKGQVPDISSDKWDRYWIDRVTQSRLEIEATPEGVAPVNPSKLKDMKRVTLNDSWTVSIPSELRSVIPGGTAGVGENEQYIYKSAKRDGAVLTYRIVPASPDTHTMVGNFNQLIDELPKSAAGMTSGEIAFKAKNVLRAHYANRAEDGRHKTTLLLQDTSGVIYEVSYIGKKEDRRIQRAMFATTLG